MIAMRSREAEGRLDALIEEAQAGEMVLISGQAGRSVQLVPVVQGVVSDAVVSAPAPPSIGRSLDRFIGTWSEADEAELLEAVKIFEQIDEIPLDLNVPTSDALR
jgi:antitoxin (DNA-binding transcriptional repressor) of toxin-antitoxin stability system